MGRALARFRPQQLIAKGLNVALLASLFAAVPLTVPAYAAGAEPIGSQLCRSTTGTGATLDTNKLNNGYYVSAATGRSGDSVTGIRIEPLFGKRMYVDPGRKFDATYIAYKVTNNTANSISNLTVALDGFSGTVIQPVSSDDLVRNVGTLAVGASKTVYFMIRATGTTSSDQVHEVRVLSGNTASGTQLAGCKTAIQGVQRSLAASANKVTSISVTGTPTLGSTFTITVVGAPGRVGQGNDIDGSIMAISPASNSSWPTKAIRLEGVSLAVRGVANSNSVLTACETRGGVISGSGQSRTATFSETLIVRAFDTCVTTTKQVYTATYTYRVIGFSATNPAITPLASIGSGTQVKYTGTLPSTQTSVPLTSTTSPISVTKSFVSSTSDASNVYASYRITATTTSVSDLTLDEIRDLPSNASWTVSASTFTDKSRTNTSVTKSNFVEGSSTYWRFQSPNATPFTINSTKDFVLNYTVTIPKPGSSTTYTNEAFAVSNNTVFGSGATITGIQLTVNSDGTTSAQTTSKKSPQVITFETPISVGNNTSTPLDPVSDSGLPVTLTSSDTTKCTVSKFNGVWTMYAIATGTCTLVASQAGDSNFEAAANVTKNITIKPGQVITYSATTFSGATAGSTASVTISATSKLSVTLISIDTDICTVSVGTAYNSSTGVTVYTITQGSATGACILQASQSGDNDWGPAPNRDITLGVGTAQAIDFSSPANNATYTYPTTTSFNVVATAKTPNTSGTNTINPVSFTSSTPEVCTVRQVIVDDVIQSGLNTSTGATTVAVDVVAPGICTITASQDGLKDDGTASGYAAAADVTKSFTINGSGTTAQTIVFDAVAGKTYGDANFDAFATSKKTSDQTNTGLLVTITTTTPAVCEVSTSALETPKSKVTVVLHSAGNCILQGNQGGNATYAAATVVTTTIVVSPKALTLSGLSATKEYDGSTSLTYSGTASISGMVPGDGPAEVSLSGTPTGSYPDEDAGNNKSVTVGGLSLSGTKASSYTLPSYQIQGTITTRAITIAFAAATVAPNANIVCIDRVSVTVGSLVRSGSITAVTCSGIPANGDDNNASTLMTAGNSTVTPSSATITESGGNKTSNYNITYVAGVITVSSKSIPTLETEPVTALYGDLELESTADTQNQAGKTKAKFNNSAIAGQLSHKKNGVAINPATLEVGVHVVTVEFTPSDTNTYDSASTTRTITITKRQLRVQGLSVTSKEYDGTRSASTTGTATLTEHVSGKGILAGDVGNVNLTGTVSVEFADANVGTNKSLGLTGLALAGSKSGNYELVNQTLTGTITKRNITFTGGTKSKLAGAADPTFGYSVTSGSFAPGEDAATIGGVGTTRMVGEDPGQYAVLMDVKPENHSVARGNYNVQTVNGKLYIARPTLNVPSSGGVITTNTVTCACEGFKPGETVTVTMYSTPNVLATSTVAQDGTCPSLAAEVPAGTTGTHDLEITSKFPNDDPITYRTSFTVGQQGGGGGGGGGSGGSSPTPTVTPSPTPTVSPTVSPTPRPTVSPTQRPTVSPTPRPSATPSRTPTPTESPFATPSPSPTQTQSALPPGSENRTIGDGLKNWLVTPPSTGQQSSDPVSSGANSIVKFDTGTDVKFTETGSVDLSSVKNVTPQELVSERIAGFKPGASLFIEVLGSRTGARFVATTASIIDTVTLVEAIKASIPAQAADFFKLDSVATGSAPTDVASWSKEEQSVAYDYFQASGLPLPVNIADLDLGQYSKWISVAGTASGYVPGSRVFLTLTSTPLVIAEGTVNRDGEIELAGSLPVEFLQAGEHRVRLVGIRAIGGVGVDENGEITLSEETMQEIERFDLGTQATVRMGGPTPEGDYLNAVRIVPLVPVAPWWTLWFILVGFLIAGIARRRNWTDTRLKKYLAVSLNLAAALPAVILGWLSTVTLVTWVGLGLGLLATGLTLLVKPKPEEARREQRSY